MSMTTRLRPLLLVLAAATLVACGPAHGNRYQRKQAQDSLKKLETPGLTIGEFHLTKVTDGDTIRVDGLESSLRLVGLDAEETFKNEHDKRAAETDFAKYMADK